MPELSGVARGRSLRKIDILLLEILWVVFGALGSESLSRLSRVSLSAQPIIESLRMCKMIR